MYLVVYFFVKLCKANFAQFSTFFLWMYIGSTCFRLGSRACRSAYGLLYYYRAQFLRAAAHVVVSCEIYFSEIEVRKRNSETKKDVLETTWPKWCQQNHFKMIIPTGGGQKLLIFLALLDVLSAKVGIGHGHDHQGKLLWKSGVTDYFWFHTNGIDFTFVVVFSVKMILALFWRNKSVFLLERMWRFHENFYTARPFLERKKAW